MNILMSGSGSGGHIYPCISLYKELVKKYNVYVLIFKNIDKKIYDENNIKYFYFDDCESIYKKCSFINKLLCENRIDKVITFGGKNSLFINVIAKKNNIDSFIFEQNIILGKANKINYLLCKKLFTNFKIGLKKEINVGNPNAFNLKMNNNSKLFKNNNITILITLGSLGSSSVNKVIENFIKMNNEYNVIYVSGNNVKTKVKDDCRTKVYKYYNNLPSLMAKCDLIISRAGASTLSEIIALNIPSIIIPSPYVANNHQEKNAKYLKEKECIELIFEKDLNENVLLSKIRNLVQNADNYNRLKTNLANEYLGNKFDLIVSEICDDNS